MNWKSTIVTALATGIVTLATGMLLFWWQEEEPELVYNSIQSIPFDDTNNTLFIQQFEVINSGNKPVEEVVFVADFGIGSIERWRINIDATIPHEKSSDEDSIRVNVNSMNEEDRFSISVLYRSPDPNNAGARVLLRGKGVNGKLIGETSDNNFNELLIAIVAAYMGIGAFFASTKHGRSSFELAFQMITNKAFGHSLNIQSNVFDNQRNIIASALSMHGYPEKAKEYLISGSNRRYWVEADLLAAEAINGDDKMKKDFIEILVFIEDLPQISPTSKSIVNYNIARIKKSLGSPENEIDEYIGKARNLNESVVMNRLARDPVFYNNKP